GACYSCGSCTGEVSFETNCGSGSDERDVTSIAGVSGSSDAAGALSNPATSVGAASADADTGTVVLAAASPVASAGAVGTVSGGFGLRSMRYQSERKIDAKSSPEAPVSDVIAPVTTKLRPSKTPAGLGPGAPSRQDSAGRMRSASRSRISTRTAR